MRQRSSSREQPVQRLVRAQVEPRRLADGRRLEPVGVAQHPRCEHAHRVERVVGVAQLGERGEGAAVQLLAFLDDPVGRLHGAAAQASFDEVDGTALDAGERRAQEREEIAARAAEPREAEQRDERLAERRLREAHLAVDRIRDAERPERRLERSAQARSTLGQMTPIALGRRAGAQEREQLLADELERTARAGGLEEADRAVDRDGLVRLVGEERALEMRERRLRDLARSAAAAPRCAPRRAAADPRRCAAAT